MSNSNSARPALGLSVLVMLVGAGAAGYFMMAAAPTELQPVVVEVQAPAVPPTPSPSSPAEPSAGAQASGGAPGAAASVKRNRLARDLAREKIWKSLGRKHALEPAGPGSAAPRPSDASKLPALAPEYIQSAISEQLVPVAIECYETALDQDPELAGKLLMNFTIIGDEEVGGVVEDAALGEGSTLDNEFVRECMRESLLSVSFPAPDAGGRVEVS